MKRLFGIGLVMWVMMIACRYTYPAVHNKKLIIEGGKPVLEATYSKETAENKTAEAMTEVTGIQTSVANPWQDRVIGVAIAVGALLMIVGIVLAIYGNQPVKGVLLILCGLADIFLFLVLAAMAAWIQDNAGKIVAVFSTILVGAIAYYGWWNKGALTSVIKGFEVQKDKVWGPETEQAVKDEQGSFQKAISNLRKKVIK